MGGWVGEAKKSRKEESQTNIDEKIPMKTDRSLFIYQYLCMSIIYMCMCITILYALTSLNAFWKTDYTIEYRM